MIPGRGLSCPPLQGTNCSNTSEWGIPLASTLVDTDGRFELTVQAASLDGLWLYSQPTGGTFIGNCGSGLRFTEQPRTDLVVEHGSLQDMEIGVASIFF